MKRSAYDMMKFLSRTLSVLLCTAVLWTACSSDDDDNNDDNGGGGSGSAAKLKAGIFVGEDDISYQLTSNGIINYVYDAQGNLTAITGDVDGDYEITISPFTMSRSNEYGTFSISKCSFNTQGYLTKFTLEEIYDYDGDYQDFTAVYSISYNGSDQISKITTKENGVEKYDGDTFKGSGSEELTFTYENGNLVTIKEVVKATESGATFKGSGLATFSYGNTVNAAKQYTVGFVHFFPIDEQVAELAMIGYLGKSSNYLPSQIDYIYNYGDEKDEESATYSYQLGATNGLVVKEKENNSTYYYKYASDTKAVDEEQLATNKMDNNAPVRRRRGALKHRFHL
jgi:hypothetical protein